MTHPQRRINYVLYAPCVLAPLSIIGSILTIVAVFRSKRDFDTYSRLVTCIAVYDICLSTALSLGPFAIPASVGIDGANGTLQTCTAQGFFMNLGTASFAYSAMLMWYYVAVIRYSVKEKVMARYIEPCMHLLGSGYFLATSFIGLHWQIFSYAGTFCFVAAWPLGCTDKEEIECERGGEHEHLFGMWLLTVPYMAFTCLIILALLIVAVTVTTRYYKSQRFDFRSSVVRNRRSSIASRQQQSSLSRETLQVVTQCILYAVLFTNVMIWTTLGTILWLRGVEYNALTHPLFAIDSMALFFFPLQGFF